jgi:Rab proteins geranylgeranyltransferase component A
LPFYLRNIIQYAIALSPTAEVKATDGIRAIQRHLTSFGMYGSFPIVVPLHGGGGELSQAFCRAAAVKGATYILGRTIRKISTNNMNEYPIMVDFNVPELNDLSTVRCKNVVRLSEPAVADCIEITRTVSVLQGAFESLFLPEAQYTDAALIVVPPGTVRPEQRSPIQIILHGGGIGECPLGQCIQVLTC